MRIPRPAVFAIILSMLAAGIVIPTSLRADEHCDPARQTVVDQQLNLAAETISGLVAEANDETNQLVVPHPTNPNLPPPVDKNAIVYGFKPMASDIDGDCLADGYVFSVWRGSGTSQFENKTAVFQSDLFYGPMDDDLVIESLEDEDGTTTGALLAGSLDMIYMIPVPDGVNGYGAEFHQAAGRAEFTWVNEWANLTVFNLQQHVAKVGSQEVDNHTTAATTAAPSPYFRVATDLVGLLDSGAALGTLLSDEGIGPEALVTYLGDYAAKLQNEADDILACQQQTGCDVVAEIVTVDPTPPGDPPLPGGGLPSLDGDSSLANRALILGWLDAARSIQPARPLFVGDFRFDAIYLLNFNNAGLPTTDLDDDGYGDRTELGSFVPAETALAVIGANPLNRLSTPDDYDGDGFPNYLEDFPYDPDLAYDFQPIVTIGPILDLDTELPFVGDKQGMASVNISFENRESQANEPYIFAIEVGLSIQAPTNAVPVPGLKCVIHPREELPRGDDNLPARKDVNVTVEFDTRLCPDSFDVLDGTTDNYFVRVELIGAATAETYAEPDLQVEDFTYTSTSFKIRNRPVAVLAEPVPGGPTHDPVNYANDKSENLTARLRVTDPTGDGVANVHVKLRANNTNQSPNSNAGVQCINTPLGTNPQTYRHDCIYAEWEYDATSLAALPEDSRGKRLDLGGLWEAHNSTASDDFLDSHNTLNIIRLEIDVTDAQGDFQRIHSDRVTLFHNDPMIIKNPTNVANTVTLPTAVVNATQENGTQVVVDFRAKFDTGDNRQSAPTEFAAQYRHKGDTEFVACDLDRKFYFEAPPGPVSIGGAQNAASGLTGGAVPPASNSFTAVGNQRHCEAEGLDNSLTPYEYFFNGTDGAKLGYDEHRPGGSTSLFEIVTYLGPEFGVPEVSFPAPDPTAGVANVEATFNVTYFDPANEIAALPDYVRMHVCASGNDTFGCQYHDMALAAGETDPLNGLYEVKVDLPVDDSYFFEAVSFVDQEYVSDNDTVTVSPSFLVVTYGHPLELVKAMVAAQLDDAFKVLGPALAGQPIPVNYWCGVNAGIAAGEPGPVCDPADPLETGCAFDHPAPPTPAFSSDRDCDGVNDATDAGADPDNKFKVPLDFDGDLFPGVLELVVEFDLWEIDATGHLLMNGEIEGAANEDEPKAIILKNPTPAGAGGPPLARIEELVDDNGAIESRLVRVTLQPNPANDPYVIDLGGAYFDIETFATQEAAASGTPTLGLRITIRNALIEQNTLGFIELNPGNLGDGTVPFLRIVLLGDGLDTGTTVVEALGSHEFEVFSDPVSVYYNEVDSFDRLIALAPEVFKAVWDDYSDGGVNGVKPIGYVGHDASHVYLNQTEDGYSFEVQVCKNTPLPGQQQPVPPRFCVLEGGDGSGDIPLPNPGTIGIRDVPCGYVFYYQPAAGPAVEAPVCVNDITGAADELLGGADNDGDFVPDAAEPLICEWVEFPQIPEDGSCNGDDYILPEV